jgi:hypothetical protein
MERLQQIEEIFHQALRHEPAQRETYIRNACQGDTDVQREVLSLLSNYEDNASSVRSPSASTACRGISSRRGGRSRRGKPSNSRAQQPRWSYTGRSLKDELDAPKHLVRSVHELYFAPRHEDFQPRTMWSLSNAFTSAFKELEPISQFKATAKLGPYLERVSGPDVGPQRVANRRPKSWVMCSPRLRPRGLRLSAARTEPSMLPLYGLTGLHVTVEPRQHDLRWVPRVRIDRILC